MYYEFAKINHISDVEKYFDPKLHIKKVTDEYIIFNYLFSSEDVFPVILDERSKILREFRGITFCAKTGNIIRRPFHKFFNVNERAETDQQTVVNYSQQYHVLEKLDGSMIVPFITANGNLIWGTKMGDTHVTPMVEEFLAEGKMCYNYFVNNLINQGYSPIFEFCSRKQKIVLDYAKEQLVLTAIRNMVTGKYMSIDEIRDVVNYTEIPIIESIYNDVSEALESVKTDPGFMEGIVIRYNDGHMVKCKSDWYVKVHRAKDAIQYEKDVVRMIIEKEIDDILPICDANDKKLLEDYQTCFMLWMEATVDSILNRLQEIHEKSVERKEYAQTTNDWFRNIVFVNYGIEYSDDLRLIVYGDLFKYMSKHLHRNSQWEEFKTQINYPLTWCRHVTAEQ